MTTKGALAPGACESQQVPWSAFGSTDVASLMCNPPPAAVAECNPYNNWTITQNEDDPKCTVTTTTTASTTPVTRLFVATCGAGTLPKWRALAWNATVPTGTSIAFRVRAVSASTAGGACTALAPVTSGAPLPVATAGVDAPAVCSISGDGGPCPVSLLSAVPTQSSCVQLDATLSPSSTASPTLLSWTVTYDCLQAQ
jgi:hypothetical protein